MASSTKTKRDGKPARAALLQTVAASATQTPALRPITRTDRASARRVRPEAAARVVRQKTMYLTPEEIRRLRMQAAQEGRPMSAIISEALGAYFAAHPLTAG